MITPGHLLPRLAGALVAQTMLATLVVGLPLGLWHYIGWPLPDHLPTLDELETVLFSPLSTPLLLDLFSCIAWPCWAIFVVDVARCVPDVARRVRIPSLGPVHALAAFLVTATVLGFLGPRTPATGPTLIVPVTHLAPVSAADHPASAPPTQPGTVVVRAPHHGIHDSLWRIANRELGDGTRWTAIWDRNKGQPQADGQLFTNPNLLRPGWTLQLPETPRVPPPPPSSNRPVTPPSPQPAQAPTAAPHPAPHPDTGITVATGAFVGLGLAALITAALITVRFWRRRVYRPGSGERAEETIAPVVRALRIAYDQATLPHDDEGTLISPEPANTAVGRDIAARDRAHTTAEAILPASNDTVLGVRDGHAVALDLTCTRGLGLVGPGAHAAARALVVSLLAEAQRKTPGDVAVVVPARDVATLLGNTTAIEHPPARLRIVADLDAALDVLETELLTRTRHATDPQTADTPAGALALLATPAPHTERRLQAVLDNGSTLGLAGVLIGQWRPGGTVRVRTDGTIAATSPNLTGTLAGTRLFTLPTGDTSGLLSLLREAQGPGQPDRDPRDEHTAHAPPTFVRDGGLPPPPPTPQAMDAPREIPEASSPTTDPHDAVHAGTDEDAEPTRRRPPLSLTVLGRVALIHTDGDTQRDLTAALTPKQREVLVYLAINRAGARREALAEAIWPDSPRARPYNSLYSTLSLLRRNLSKATDDQLSEITRNDDGRYHLDPTLVTVDHWQFHDALRTRRRTPTDAQRLEALQQATELYRGGLAEDLSTEWIEAPREATRRDALDALGVLIRALGDRDPDRMLDLLERARVLDPYNEGVYRDIIRTQALLGQQEAIPRTLILLTTTLAELDQHPSSETTTLAEFLQRRSHQPTRTGNAAAS
ncbi:MAG: BTAD domain-containing putative transcriptional regulator [Pseudonocardiaceae bacterium]